MAYCVRIDEVTDPNITQHHLQCAVEGMWLSAELPTWGGPVHHTTMYEVCVFKAGVDLYTPSDGTQPTMPDKEQLRLAALRAARESWLQALRAAGLASRARQDAALAQASRQALLEGLRHHSHGAGSAMSMRQLRLALAACNLLAIAGRQSPRPE